MFKIIFGIFIVIYIIISIILSKYLSNLISIYKVETSSYLSSKEIIEFILQEKKIFGINIEKINKKNIDNYNIEKKTIYLSDNVYDSNELSSKIIALHECGHALQDDSNYIPLKIRKYLLPIFNIINIFGILFVLMGILISKTLLSVGIYMILLTIVFQILTVEIEIEASYRIYKITKKYNLLSDEELNVMKQILTISAISYIFSLFNFLILRIIRKK